MRNVSGEKLYAAKEASGFSDDFWACDTAKVGGYTIEGHVPVNELMRVLDERPSARGIATSGMPAGSQGMEYGNEREAFDVMLVGPIGSSRFMLPTPATESACPQ